MVSLETDTGGSGGEWQQEQRKKTPIPNRDTNEANPNREVKPDKETKWI